MNCREALRRMLEEEPAREDLALSRHVASCVRCRQAQALVADLRERGRAGQSCDLSVRSIRDTRRRVAGILAAPPAHQAVLWGIPALRLAAACAALLFSVALLVRVGQPSQQPESYATRNRELDTRISHLQRQMERERVLFQERHLDAALPTTFEMRADRLKALIAMSSWQIERELGKSSHREPDSRQEDRRDPVL